MPAGLEVFGDDGQVQIDGSTPHITLLRKGSVISSNLNWGRGVALSLASIPLMRNEILAFRPAPGQYGNVYGWMGDMLTLFVTGRQTPIEYWVFSPHVPSGLNYGMQLFDENETMIYDTGRAVMNVLGTHEGLGGPVAWGAQGVALIPGQTHAYVFRDVSPFAGYVLGSGEALLTAKATLGVAAVSGNSTYSKDAVIEDITDIIPRGTTDSSSSFLFSDNAVDNKFLVISTDNL